MDDAGGLVLLFGICILAVVGGIHLAMDFRHYNELYKQCQEQGFIQNETTRITCKVEV